MPSRESWLPGMTKNGITSAANSTRKCSYSAAELCSTRSPVTTATSGCDARALSSTTERARQAAVSKRLQLGPAPGGAAFSGGWNSFPGARTCGSEISLDGLLGELYLQGAQVTAWQPWDERPVYLPAPRAHSHQERRSATASRSYSPWFGPSRHAPSHSMGSRAPRLGTSAESKPRRASRWP